ncbi:hypothetical protein OG352_17465 [Streptomyces sp. NBC_01485]|uniref:hypothetical protein n=1 Tax=Streptomyces sp. NBC_01485 TaxID=2903884 RepID=UPI002E339E76|nr:hypothetical protein [Streptomyces sp. NBC_01485]
MPCAPQALEPQAQEAEVRSSTAAPGQDRKDAARAAQAAQGWLLLAAKDQTRATKEWEELKAALLDCGRTFAVVKMQPEVVWAAAGTKRMEEADAYLAQVLHGGPVFVTLRPHRYYALVPAQTAERYEWKHQERKDAKFLGLGSFVAVPAPDLTEPDGARAYWSVPVGGAGALCSADAVSQLLAHGRYNLARESGR